MNEEMSLPEGWINTHLGQAIDYGKCEKINPDELSNDTWVLELEDIEKDSSKIIQMLSFYERKSKSTKNKFSEGNVLYGKLRPYLNKVVIAKKAGVCTTEIVPLDGGKYLHNNYLFHWLKHPLFTQYVTTVGYGVNMPRLGTKEGNEAPFVLAPLAEQHQIAQRLDELLAQVDTIKARLDAIPAILKRFRQSVLSAAVSGKLTEEWRGNANYDEKDGYKIAVTWSIQALKDICLKVQSGSTPKNNPFEQGGNIPFLKVYNIVDQKISFEYKPQFVTNEVHSSSLKRSIVVPYDILMNIVGPPLGKVAIVPDSYKEWNINQAITLFRVNPELLDYKYLYYVLCEGKLVRDIMPETKGSVGQINISLSQCRDFNRHSAANLGINYLIESTE